jgi:hypothetical protein
MNDTVINQHKKLHKFNQKRKKTEKTIIDIR